MSGQFCLANCNTLKDNTEKSTNHHDHQVVLRIQSSLTLSPHLSLLSIIHHHQIVWKHCFLTLSHHLTLLSITHSSSSPSSPADSTEFHNFSTPSVPIALNSLSSSSLLDSKYFPDSFSTSIPIFHHSSLINTRKSCW